MKILNIKKLAIATVLLVGMTSCDTFLNRPVEDSYTIDGFYKNDDQCFQAVNTIYNSPWYDFQRGFIKIGDVLAGNVYWPNSPYLNFSLKSNDADLANASASLWSVNAYCNGLIENINLKAGSQVTQETKNTVKGEAMTLKALSYFFLVRCFGAVPIIHNNSAIISANNANQLKRNNIEDVYTYIVKDLEKAIELLPEHNKQGRIDKYSAYGLLAKVYLTKSGVGSTTGTRNADDLAKAAMYAKKVIDESGRHLLAKYSDVFRLANNFSEESLIAWEWTVGTHWTCQNTLQADLALSGWCEDPNTWGSYTGLSIDLQNAFGEDATKKTADARVNDDDRRKATMMMMGDHYDYFWEDHGGFTYDWIAKKTLPDGTISAATYGSGTGSNFVKNIVGDNFDHIKGSGIPLGVGTKKMSTALSTHILRLADVYLIYAEAVLGDNASTSDAGALSAFNAVRGRSIKNYTAKTSITFNDIFKERRLELACEGDNWYDFVRLSYYKPEEAKARLTAQERGSWDNIDAFYSGSSSTLPTLNTYKVPAGNIFFTIPFPDADLAMNPHLMEDPVKFDFSSISF